MQACSATHGSCARGGVCKGRGAGAASKCWCAGARAGLGQAEKGTGNSVEVQATPLPSLGPNPVTPTPLACGQRSSLSVSDKRSKNYNPDRRLRCLDQNPRVILSTATCRPAALTPVRFGTGSEICRPLRACCVAPVSLLR